MRISIFSIHKDETRDVENKILFECEQRGYEIDDENPDLVIYVGGDGTFLHCIRQYQKDLDEISFVGVKVGGLGFFYDFDEESISELFHLLDEDKLKDTFLPLLEGKYQTFDGTEEDFVAMNEVKLISNNTSIQCDVSVDDEFFSSYFGNGIILSSAVGSTGLNKSYGGPVLEQDKKMFSLTPIAPLNSSVYHTILNSIVFSGDHLFRFDGDLDAAQLVFDYQIIEEKIMNVEVKYSDKTIHLLFEPNRSFIENLQRNFIS